jgi:LmbE family N-acetylglucosaminyl deacetylase
MNVVSVMAHQDDELICLGTMLKMQSRGAALHFIVLTDGSGGMVQAPAMGRAEAAAIRDREMRALAEKCGATYQCLGERDEYLYDTPDVRDRLINAIRAAAADLIFTHFSPDYSVDHMTVNTLVRQCAMQAPFPMIETEAPPIAKTPAVFLGEPSGYFDFEPTHYVDITDVFECKIELVLYHRSQDEAFRATFGKGLDDWVREMGRVRGSQVQVEFAEAFRPMFARGLVKPHSILP